MIAESVLDLIGNTPLVRVPRLIAEERLRCDIAIKMEMLNPGGSAKDRIAVAMIDAAERDGKIVPGGTIVEPTSGNTGVGLAIVAAQRGYHCIFVCTDKVSPAKVDLLRAYGAKVIVCPVAVPPEDPDSYYSVAERLTRETPGAFRPNQYANPNNPAAHEATTGPEIWNQTAGTVTHFVAGMGTGGTITGTARYLKAQNPAVVVVGADSESSVYTGGSGRPYLVEGIGEDFFPDAIDLSFVDVKYPISDEDSFLMTRRIARTEGILLGGSGGSAVCAALQVAKDHDLGPEHRIVIVVPDGGRAYLQREYNDQWMSSYGFLRAENTATVASVIESRGEELPPLLYANPSLTVREAISLMRAHDVSQLPVCKNEPPFAAAEVIGAVDELRLMDVVFRDPSAIDKSVEHVMGARLPTVGVGEPLEIVVSRLDQAPAVLVLAGGRPRAVLSRTDVLRFLQG